MINKESSYLFSQQVGTQPPGTLHCLVEFPLADFRLVPAEQDFRHLPPLVAAGAGIDGSREHIVHEAVGKCALVVADDTRDKPDNGVGNDGCRQFTASQDEVADGNLPCDEVVAYALINAFVMPRKNDEVSSHGEVIGVKMTSS